LFGILRYSSQNSERESKRRTTTPCCRLSPTKPERFGSHPRKSEFRIPIFLSRVLSYLETTPHQLCLIYFHASGVVSLQFSTIPPKTFFFFSFFFFFFFHVFHQTTTHLTISFQTFNGQHQKVFKCPPITIIPLVKFEKKKLKLKINKTKNRKTLVRPPSLAATIIIEIFSHRIAYLSLRKC
jgi:hypothetical protein